MKIKFPSMSSLKRPDFSGLSRKLSVSSPSLAGQFPRLVTGLILAAVLLACLLLGGPFLTVALAVVSAVALFEFLQMCWPGKTRMPTKVFGLAMAAFLFCPVGGPSSVSVVTVLVVLWVAVAFLIEYGRGNDHATLLDQAPLLLGFVYIPVLLHLTLFLTLREQFLVVAAAIASDIAAYYVGCAFGSHKIWPRVSPKKSWEGSAAGLVACVAVTLLITSLPHSDGPLPGGVVAWLFIGIFLGVSAQAGDFFESALKRSRQVKDSSDILPGHGGILDRIDSILFVLAAYWTVKLLAAHFAGLGSLFHAA